MSLSFGRLISNPTANFNFESKIRTKDSLVGVETKEKEE
jgi:hypothetical protein